MPMTFPSDAAAHLPGRCVTGKEAGGWLAPIPGLLRRDPDHCYWLGDHLFPVSITGVLAAGKSSYAMARIAATQAIWQPRGTTCHLALELSLKAQRATPRCQHRQVQLLEHPQHGEVFAEYADWVEPLLDHRRWQQVQVIASERPTCCLVRNVAGTYDTAYLDPALPIPGDRPSWAAGPARVLADLKTLAEGGSTYCTRAQIGGYMALESSQGQWFDYGQTIWCRPGRTQFSAPYSRRECLLAWAAAWSHYTGAHRPF
jgi:hypothetical protein